MIWSEMKNEVILFFHGRVPCCVLNPRSYIECWPRRSLSRNGPGLSLDRWPSWGRRGVSDVDCHAMNPRPSTEAPLRWTGVGLNRLLGGSVKISELYTSSLVMPSFDLCPLNTSLSKPNMSETQGAVYLPHKPCGRSTPWKGLFRGDWSTLRALSDWHGYVYPIFLC